MSQPYRRNIRVRFSDTDANGHAYFGNYFVFADEVVGEYLAHLGWDPNEILSGDYLAFTVNAKMDFLGESMPGDTLEVEVKPERVGNSSVVIAFSMINLRTGEHTGQGSFTFVFVDRRTRKSRSMPEFFRVAIMKDQPELESRGHKN